MISLAEAGQIQFVVIAANAEMRIRQQINQARAARPARVVVLSEKPTWQGARAAFEAGAYDYLPALLPREEMD